MHFDNPLRKWRTLLGDRVTLAGGLETRCLAYIGAPVRYMDPECAVGAAVAVLAGGADAVYLFNHFQRCRWSAADYGRRLNAFRSLEELCKLPRRHVVTHREVVVPGHEYRAPLPATGGELSFALPLGPTPLADWRSEAIIQVAGQTADPSAVSVNGVACALAGRDEPENGNRVLTYSVPLRALPGRGNDTVAVTATKAGPSTVLGVEVRVFPPEPR